MTWFFSLIAGIPGLLNGLLAYLNKRQDTAVAQNANAKDVDIAVVQAEIARQNSSQNIIVAGMNHRVWWIAWGLGVLPVMLYYASIFWSSTFPALGWTVLKAPADALDFAKLVVGSMFGIAGASSIVAGVAQVWAKRA